MLQKGPMFCYILMATVSTTGWALLVRCEKLILVKYRILCLTCRVNLIVYTVFSVLQHNVDDAVS